MKLRHLKVANFRGIKSLDWHTGGDFLCLLGPGDACKSTVLDAIELVLSPRWNPSFEDVDFHNADTSQEIVIEVTVGDLPRRFISDAKFGLRLRGYRSVKPAIHDEPEEGDEEVITIRLAVGSSLEPTWHVVTDRHPEPAVISMKERETLGVVRMGAVVDRHLSWSRGSVLSRLTGDSQEHAQMLADAGREARRAVDPTKLPKLTEASSRTAALSAKFGVVPHTKFEPRLDPSIGTTGTGTLTLHDGPVPLRRAGTGTRRLVTLAMQRDVERRGGVILIDEVEQALEPYRLRRLLAQLLKPAEDKQTADNTKPAAPEPGGVVVLTTHSPIAISQLRAHHLRVVRTDAAGTRILTPGAEAQGHLIAHAEALLSRRVIVCEGKTEMGLLLGLDQEWSKGADPFATKGVALVDGGGRTKVAPVAMTFRGLEYETAILADSDEPLSMTDADLEAKGVKPVRWGGSVATEQRLFEDLPWEAVVSLVNAAIDEGHPVQAQLATALKCSTKDLAGDPAGWQSIRPVNEVKAKLGVTAKKGEWFKNVRFGSLLGETVARFWDQLGGTDLHAKLDAIRTWALA